MGHIRKSRKKQIRSIAIRKKIVHSRNNTIVKKTLFRRAHTIRVRSNQGTRHSSISNVKNSIVSQGTINLKESTRSDQNRNNTTKEGTNTIYLSYHLLISVILMNRVKGIHTGGT